MVLTPYKINGGFRCASNRCSRTFSGHKLTNLIGLSQEFFRFWQAFITLGAKYSCLTRIFFSVYQRATSSFWIKHSATVTISGWNMVSKLNWSSKFLNVIKMIFRFQESHKESINARKQRPRKWATEWFRSEAENKIALFRAWNGPFQGYLIYLKLINWF